MFAHVATEIVSARLDLSCAMNSKYEYNFEKSILVFALLMVEVY